MSQDYPDGMGRLLPGHTIDLETGFAQPWYNGSSVVIASGQTGSYTLSFNDDEHIYYIDEINVSPSAYKEFTVIVCINDVPYVCGSVMGFYFHNLRVNPSLLFITGDEVKVEILNLDASQRTFTVKIHGTKVSRPVGYGKAPGAYFTATPEITDIITWVGFTDASLNTPTSWDWDFDDETAHSTSQNPYHLYSVAGTYQPKLKAINLYGWDTYSEHDMIVVKQYCYFPNWAEVDTGGKFSVADHVVTIVGNANSANAYLYRDYGVSHFTGFTIEFNLTITTIKAGLSTQIFSLANDVGPWNTDTNGRLYAVLWNAVSSAPFGLHFGYRIGGKKYEASVSLPSIGTYYIRISKSYASTTMFLYVYSDAAFTVLVASSSLTNAVLSNLSFRYIYTYSTAGADNTSGESLALGNYNMTLL